MLLLRLLSEFNLAVWCVGNGGGFLRWILPLVRHRKFLSSTLALCSVENMNLLQITQYNWLSVLLPPTDDIVKKLLRQAFIGFCASAVSDTISNSLRVLKTYRQVNQSKIGYRAAAVKIIQEEGWLSLFGRGLGTRILANGIQGIMFSVLWKVSFSCLEFCSGSQQRANLSPSTVVPRPLVLKACIMHIIKSA